MTKFCFFKRDGVYFGFEETGHAGFGESGDDIVCAAFSAMTMLIINAIEVSYASSVEYEIDQENASIRAMAYGALPEHEDDECKRFAVAGLIQAYFIQLNDMLEEYYDYMDVTEQEA